MLLELEGHWDNPGFLFLSSSVFLQDFFFNKTITWKLVSK